MKKQKREFKIFTIAEYEQEQEYLRSQHQKGWKLVHLTFPGIYLFEACEKRGCGLPARLSPTGIGLSGDLCEYVQGLRVGVPV